MIKNDYTSIMLNELYLTLDKLKKLKKEKNLDKSMDLINDSLKQFLGLRFETIDILPYKDLMSIISSSAKINVAKSIVLSELLKEKANLYELKGESIKSFNTYIKSLNIFIELILRENKLCTEEFFNKIDEIVYITGQYELPLYSKSLLFQYYEVKGEYSKAEDMIFEILDENKDNKETIKKAKDFYERLKCKSEEELEKGNLPLDEVLDGLNQLNNL